jgi:hypothetical protein
VLIGAHSRAGDCTVRSRDSGSRVRSRSGAPSALSGGRSGHAGESNLAEGLHRDDSDRCNLVLGSMKGFGDSTHESDKRHAREKSD